MYHLLMAFNQVRNTFWTWKSAWNKKHAQYVLWTKVCPVICFDLIIVYCIEDGQQGPKHVSIANVCE
jgi:hypothetical protein